MSLRKHDVKEGELPTFGVAVSSMNSYDKNDQLVLGDIDIRTRAVIEGASPNDPRALGPTQLETNDGGQIKRNSFACVSCHSLKQKCVPSDPHDIYRKPCERCLRNFKLCKFDLSKRTRKRRRRDMTDSPVYMESSTKAQLASTLPEQQSTPYGAARNLPHIWSGIAPPATDSATIQRLNASSLSSSASPVFGDSRNFTPEENRNGEMKKQVNMSHLYLMKPIFKRQLHSLLLYQKGKVGEISRKLDAWANQWNELVQEGTTSFATVSDPISRNLISMKEAEIRYELWNSEFSSRFKFVKSSSTLSLNQLRQEKPILLSVIMSCVSVVMTSKDTTMEKNMKLDNFVLNLITDQIFKLNHKSIELVESLLTLCLWYNFPEWSNKTRYHIFNYVCVCLIKDLGPNSVSRAFGMFSDEDPSKRKRKSKTPLELYDNSARLIILVYISSLNISIFLKQPIQARWSLLIEKACEELLGNTETKTEEELYHPDDDKTLVVFARLNFILEKVHIYLHEIREEHEFTGMSDSYFKHLTEKFQSQLTVIFVQMPKDRHRELSFFYSVEAYLYQYIINNYAASQKRMTTAETLPLDVSEAFQKCYNYCASALEEFVKMTPKLVASLPLFHMSRIIYTVGLLLFKLRYSTLIVPCFQQFKMLTENSIPLVNKVAETLEQCSKIYEFNNFLFKFQYVVALFAQTYANKVGEVMNNTSKRSHENNDTVGNHSQTETIVPELGGLLDSNSADKFSHGRPNGADPATVSNGQTAPFVATEVQASPANSADTINDYLTDVDSLMWGFNVLNDEFWTDIFTNDL